VNPQSRASAWHILKWAQELYIDTILIENVPEFRTWGPVGTNGKPLKIEAGRDVSRLPRGAPIARLQGRGPHPQFGRLRRSDDPPAAVHHGPPRPPSDRAGRRQRIRRPAARRCSGRRSAGAPRARSSTGRSREEHLQPEEAAEAGDDRAHPRRPREVRRPELKPFLVVLRNHAWTGSRSTGRSRRSTAQGQHVGLAQPFLMHITHGRTQPRALGRRPVPTITDSEARRVRVVESFVLPQHGGGALRPADQPLPTIATDGAIAVVEPFIVQTPLRFAPMRVESVDEPLPTITATGGRLLRAGEPFLVPFYMSGPKRQHARSRSVDEPMPTITGSGSGKLGVVEPFLTKYNRTATGAYSVNEPVDTITHARPLRPRRAVSSSAITRSVPASESASTTSTSRCRRRARRTGTRSSSRSSTATCSTSTSGCCSRTSSRPRRRSRRPTVHRHARRRREADR
jgi:DNA (cytosine-5)-methyltransferase 1